MGRTVDSRRDRGRLKLLVRIGSEQGKCCRSWNSPNIEPSRLVLGSQVARHPVVNRGHHGVGRGRGEADRPQPRPVRCPPFVEQPGEREQPAIPPSDVEGLLGLSLLLPLVELAGRDEASTPPQWVAERRLLADRLGPRIDRTVRFAMARVRWGTRPRPSRPISRPGRTATTSSKGAISIRGPNSKVCEASKRSATSPRTLIPHNKASEFTKHSGEIFGIGQPRLLRWRPLRQ